MVCSHIIWAIIDDGQSFFGKKLMQASFWEWTIRFPHLLLEAIARDICFAMTIQFPLYPSQWEVRVLEGQHQIGRAKQGGVSNGVGGGGGIQGHPWERGAVTP